MNNYYELLEIRKAATPQEIKSAYKKLAFKYHPDRNANLRNTKEAEEKFKLINEAYQTLSDPVKKSRYDNQLEYERTKKEQFYQNYTSAGDYSNYQNTYQNTTGQRRNYQNQSSRRKPSGSPLVFGKTEAYFLVGFTAFVLVVVFFASLINDYSFNSHVEEAKLAIQNKNWQEANILLYKANDQVEKHPEIHFLQAIVEIEGLGKPKKGLEYLTDAINYTEKDDKETKIKYYKARAEINLLLNENYDAISDYKEIIVLGGYDKDILMLIADLYLAKLKNYDQASLYFDKVIEQEPKLPEPYIGKAVAKMYAKDYEAMGEMLNKALEMNPENGFLWYYKGFYFWERPIPKSTENLEEVRQKAKKNACESWQLALKYGNEEAKRPIEAYCE